MSNEKIEAFLFDIFIAIKKIDRVISQYPNVNDLVHDFTSWDSVLRELDIIGIAGKKIVKNGLIRREFQLIIYLANSISKRYFAINKQLIWNMIRANAKDFENEIIKLIGDIETDYKNELIDSFIDENYYLDFVVESLKRLKR